MYKVVGFNKAHNWKFGTGADAKSGLNQEFYCIDSTPLRGEKSAGYRIEKIKAPMDYPSKDIEIGRSYNFYFNKFGTLVDHQEVKDVK